MAGRTRISAFFIYCLVLSGFVYPAVVYWEWSGNAWLTTGRDGIGYAVSRELWTGIQCTPCLAHA